MILRTALRVGAIATGIAISQHLAHASITVPPLWAVRMVTAWPLIVRSATPAVAVAIVSTWAVAVIIATPL